MYTQFICIRLLVLNQIIASRWIYINLYGLDWQTSVCDSSLKLDGTVRGYRWMTIIVYWNSFNHRLACSMNPETAVTCTHGAVYIYKCVRINN